MKREARIISIVLVLLQGVLPCFPQKFTAVNEQGNELKYKVLSEARKTVTVTGRKDKLLELSIPATIEYNGVTYTVTEIDRGAFYYDGLTSKKKKPQSLSLPSTLKTIREEAFVSFNNLTELRLPEGLIEIEKAAFFNNSCASLFIPESVKIIGKGAFAGPFWSEKDYVFESLPAMVNEENCEKMGFTKACVIAYIAEHPRNTPQQQQVVYVQASSQGVQPISAVLQPAAAPSSDVDLNIPETSSDNENTFAVIIANENYQEEVKVEYALNDGEMFRQYCNKVLGLPKDNIHIRKDATLNNIKAELTWMQKVATAYKGQARFILYYAGHGVPDEKSGTSYLLPVDGKGTVLETGYSLANLYQLLGSLKAECVTVFMDACFSGSKRGDGMLASARGVAIKSKQQEPKGKMVVFSAAQGDETAYPFKEKEHGLFTYYLLKKLKETKGNVSYEELGNYITNQVSRKSIVANGKDQTPTVCPSASIANQWKALRLR